MKRQKGDLIGAGILIVGLTAGIAWYASDALTGPHWENHRQPVIPASIMAKQKSPDDVPWFPTPADVSLDAGGEGDGTYTGDLDFEGGAPVKTDAAIDCRGVRASAPARVYQSARAADSGLHYVFPHFDPGEPVYVRLHFAEIVYKEPGKRLQTVLINNVVKLKDFDIIAEAHAPNKAVIKAFSVRADSTGTVTVLFENSRGGALINAIEASGSKLTALESYTGERWTMMKWQPRSYSYLNIKRTSSLHDDYQTTLPGGCNTYVDNWNPPVNGVPYTYKVWEVNAAGDLGPPVYFHLTPHVFTSFHLNAGGVAVGKYEEGIGRHYWMTVSGQVLGAPVSWPGAVDMSGAKDPAPEEVYHSAMSGKTMVLELDGLPVETDYLIRLHFMENEPAYSGIGKRRFLVRANHTKLLDRFDIYAEAGAPHKVVIKEFRMHLGGGSLQLEFNTGYQQEGPATVSAVDIIRLPSQAGKGGASPAKPDIDALLPA